MRQIAIWRRAVLTAIVCAIILLGGNAAKGQGIITGSISGTVVDSTGAVIPAASVTVTDLTKGTSFNTKAQSDGNFAFQALPIGTYSLTITSSGFATTRISAVGVETGVDRFVGKQVLGVGAASTVTVEALPGTPGANLGDASSGNFNNFLFTPRHRKPSRRIRDRSSQYDLHRQDSLLTVSTQQWGRCKGVPQTRALEEASQ
jgi:hypothetical protein